MAKLKLFTRLKRLYLLQSLVIRWRSLCPTASLFFVNQNYLRIYILCICNNILRKKVQLHLQRRFIGFIWLKNTSSNS
jgi:hypothetical protein